MVGRYCLQLKDNAPLPVGRDGGPLVPQLEFAAWGNSLTPKLAGHWRVNGTKTDAIHKWRRRTVDEAHALFNQLGLNGDFWRLN